MISPQAVQAGMSVLSKLSGLLGQDAGDVAKRRMIALGNLYLGNVDLTALDALIRFATAKDGQYKNLIFPVDPAFADANGKPIPVMLLGVYRYQAQQVLSMLQNAGAIDSFNRPVFSVVGIPPTATAGTGLNAPGAVGTAAKSDLSGVFKGGTTTNLVPAAPTSKGIGPLILLIPLAAFFGRKAGLI